MAGEIRVQDEQGTVHVFPDGSTPEMIAKAMNVNPPSGNTVKAAPTPGSWEWFKQGAANVGVGAAKETGNIGLNVSRATPAGFFLPKDNPQALQPQGTAQAIGKGVVDVGSFLLPGLGEEDAIATGLGMLPAKLGPYAAPILRVIYNSLTSGVVNKAVGGDFTTGAAVGAGAGALSEGAKAFAPTVAETALRIGKADKAYGKTVGQTVLNQTTGISPEAVSESAQDVINQLQPKMESLLQGKNATTADAVKVVDDAISRAATKNNKQALDQLQAIKQQLTVWQSDIPSLGIKAGDPIPSNLPASQLLDLKRGIRDQFIKNWNPDLMSGTRATAAQVASAADKSLDAVAGPEFPKLNQQISSLIPAHERGEALSLAPTLSQRVAGRVAARTGALALSTGGAALGYKEGGIPGAVVGGVAGAALPEMLADPTAQMLVARLLHSGLSPKVAQALVLSIMQGGKMVPSHEQGQP